MRNDNGYDLWDEMFREACMRRSGYALRGLSRWAALLAAVVLALVLVFDQAWVIWPGAAIAAVMAWRFLWLVHFRIRLRLGHIYPPPMPRTDDRPRRWQ